MNIKHCPSPHFESRDNYKPDIIVCHIAEGTYNGTVSWFQNPKSKVSSHFVVGKNGEIAQCVDLKKAAWCNGTDILNSTNKRHYSKSTLKTVVDRKANANLYSISIEFEGKHAETKGELTVKQLEAAVDLIRYIRKEVKNLFGIDIPPDKEHIVGHCQINPITKPFCPGEKFQMDEIISRVRQLESTTYCVHVPSVSTYGECKSIKQWIQNNAPYNVIIEEE